MIAMKNEGIIPEMEEVKRKKNYRIPIRMNVTAYLKALNGIDITEITGISEIGALTVLSEAGTDMSKWKTDKNFTSWPKLAPNTKISGGKLIGSRVPGKKYCAGQSFRMAAMSLQNSKGPLGDYYRRIRIYAGAPKAIVAVARKLAVIYYHMMTARQTFNPVELEKSQKNITNKKLNS